MASLPGPLRSVTPHQIAEMIRGLDSRLAGIEYDERAGEPVLVYRFEMAGGRQAFALAAAPGLLTSIADLYPEADTYEREIERRYGLRFRHPDIEAAEKRRAGDTS